MRRARRLFATLSLVTLGIAGMPASGSVSAAPSQITPQEPGSAGITQHHVTIWPRYENKRLVVQVYGKNFRKRKLNGLDLWIGVKNRPARARKPEYVLQWLLPRDGDGVKSLRLYRVGGFRDNTRVLVRNCPAKYGHKHLKKGYVEVSVPWRCLGGLSKVRINATTWNFTKYNSSGWPTRGYHHSTPEYRKLTIRKF